MNRLTISTFGKQIRWRIFFAFTAALTLYSGALSTPILGLADSFSILFKRSENVEKTQAGHRKNRHFR